MLLSVNFQNAGTMLTRYVVCHLYMNFRFRSNGFSDGPSLMRALQTTNGLAGTWGKAHASGVTHQTPNAEVFQSDKAFNDIANRLLTKEMTPVPE